ncbi:hypothetical protein, conserved [Plasmodium gonderi]|uniref:GPI transamidase component PIG-S n=1 Tax=Plasmodium gonderi TaxID=77519 RepID=A0A1Y1JMY9_PLAGO|nr:hypothetical protein, conserved [Plasmodium gonderi]GAW83849.1 hypothetical protein, conserved [Plasmodium gonderi]
MNSRIYCIISYALSFIVCAFVIFWLNKYERQGVPLQNLSRISSIVQDIYDKNGKTRNKWENEKWTNKNVSHLSINIYILSTQDKRNTDSFGIKLKEFIEKEIELEYNERPVAHSLSDVKDLFFVNPHFISNDEKIKNDENWMYKYICLSGPEQMDMYEVLINKYFICLNENIEKTQNVNLSFSLNTSNIIQVNYNNVEDNSNKYYELFIKETWTIIKNTFLLRSKNRSLSFTPELDLNFYLASSLYNEENYKVGKSYPKDQIPKEDSSTNGKNNEIVENFHKSSNELDDSSSINADGEDTSTSTSRSEEITRSEEKKTNLVFIATWDFYNDVYYPYLRNFIERLLNIYQINVYTQIIANIDLFKISEKAQVYLKGEEAQKAGNKRIIILDKINKFTNIFDDVTFDNILKKPTYQIPKSINFIAIFPNKEEIFFHNPANEKFETTVSFVEWGIVHINNLFHKLNNMKGKKKKKKYIDISDQSPFISGIFISHLRGFLGLCTNLSDYIFTIFNSDKYEVKYIKSESTDNKNIISYFITSRNKLNFSFFYNTPLKKGISDFEILALMREAYIYYIVEALKNLNKLVSISNISIYFKVPTHTLPIYNRVLDNLNCSLDFMRGEESCKKAGHINKLVLETLHPYVKLNHTNDPANHYSAAGEDYNDNILNNEQWNRYINSARSQEMYFKAALILAQSAYQDSLQLLMDDTFSIYDILSKDFLLASVLPILIPYAIPVTFSLFREFFKIIKKQKQKVD